MIDENKKISINNNKGEQMNQQPKQEETIEDEYGNQQPMFEAEYVLRKPISAIFDFESGCNNFKIAHEPRPLYIPQDYFNELFVRVAVGEDNK